MSSKFSNLGDRMKAYERAETGRTFMPGLPLIARLDGRAFHSFTRGLPRPYSEDLQKCRINTLRGLVEKSGATIGYAQSDEFTLVWDRVRDDFLFGAKVHKLTSVLTSIISVLFYREVVKNLPPQYRDRIPTFDCRVWQVPNEQEAINCLLWREQDATKNSISMAASTYYRPGELHKKNEADQQEMLFQKGINWNDYPTWFKRGNYVAKVEKHCTFTKEQISELPEKHKARSNPEMKFLRSVLTDLDIPPLSKLIGYYGGNLSLNSLINTSLTTPTELKE